MQRRREAASEKNARTPRLLRFCVETTERPRCCSADLLQTTIVNADPDPRIVIRSSVCTVHCVMTSHMMDLNFPTILPLESRCADTTLECAACSYSSLEHSVKFDIKVTRANLRFIRTAEKASRVALTTGSPTDTKRAMDMLETAVDWLGPLLMDLRDRRYIEWKIRSCPQAGQWWLRHRLALPGQNVKQMAGSQGHGGRPLHERQGSTGASTSPIKSKC